MCVGWEKKSRTTVLGRLTAVPPLGLGIADSPHDRRFVVCCFSFEMQLIDSILLVSTVLQGDSVTRMCMHYFLPPFPLWFIVNIE